MTRDPQDRKPPRKPRPAPAQRPDSLPVLNADKAETFDELTPAEKEFAASISADTDA